MTKLLRTLTAMLIVVGSFLFFGALASAIGNVNSSTPDHTNAWNMFWGACACTTVVVAVVTWENW